MAVFSTGFGVASELDDEPTLEISGAVKNGATTLSRAVIERLPKRVVDTKTPWHSGVTSFEGVLMRDLLKIVEARGTRISVTALNKYSTSIPMDDFSRFDAILAYKKDGKYMTVREKGPFFIIYPYDSDPVLKADKYYNRSAWQVATITVEP
jgi:hypothetical protein